jgi:outer membrane receptor protein involved in Fe transport
MKGFLFLCFLALHTLSMSQISGIVVSGDSKEPAVGARVSASDGLVTATDPNGKFKLNCKSFPVTLITKLNTFKSDTTIVNGPGEIIITLKPVVQEIGDMVVTASRRQQDVEEVAVSMEIIKPSLIESKGFTNLEQTVNQSPGVFTMDGQASIRGGGGYSYGAGSRVLLVWNGTPMVAPDVGDVKWNAIPMENMSQIEVLKGASSVLYGSGALNGIVAITEREPGLKLEYLSLIHI